MASRPVGWTTARVRALTRRRLGAAASDLVEAIRSKTSEFSASLPYSFVCEVTCVLRELFFFKESAGSLLTLPARLVRTFTER